MSLLPTRLVVTIDTERDKGPRWETPAGVTFRGVTEALPELLAPLFAEFGVRPTYFLSPEVITDPGCCDIFRGLSNCELGTHLHAEYVTPQPSTWDLAMPTSGTNTMQLELNPALEREKLETLSELFYQQFDRQPKSFRAGRFGISKYTGKVLMDLGYLVDSSVTPHIRWRTTSGRKVPDFRRSRELPYTIGSNGNIYQQGQSSFLEVPVTVLGPGDVASAAPGEPVWFRPWYSSAQVLRDVIHHCVSQTVGPVSRPLVMMFHIMEVVPGCSPYPQTADEVVAYVRSLRAAFETAAELGVESRTLFEYYQEFTALSFERSVQPTSLLGRISAAWRQRGNR